MSKIYDDYDGYQAICEDINIDTVDIHSGFYDHQVAILRGFGFNTTQEYWDHREKTKRRGARKKWTLR